MQKNKKKLANKIDKLLNKAKAIKNSHYYVYKTCPDKKTEDLKKVKKEFDAINREIWQIVAGEKLSNDTKKLVEVRYYKQKKCGSLIIINRYIDESLVQGNLRNMSDFCYINVSETPLSLSFLESELFDNLDLQQAKDHIDDFINYIKKITSYHYIKTKIQNKNGRNTIYQQAS